MLAFPGNIGYPRFPIFALLTIRLAAALNAGNSSYIQQTSHGKTTVQLALRMSYQPKPTALGLVAILDHFPISRYNIPVTRRIGFVSSRPKTVLNKPKRPDPTVWTCYTACLCRGCQL